MALGILAGLCLAWYVFIVTVSLLGTIQLARNYSRVPPAPTSSALPLQQVPHVTIIRPIKGLEPWLEDCLLSAFAQDYPSSKITIHLCISTRSDTSLPLLRQLIRTHTSPSAKIFIDDDHPSPQLGPNPKICNMSRAYTEAKGDIVWILDSNVWVDRSACGHMVDRLHGFGPGGSRTTPYKLVHQLPIVMAVPDEEAGSKGQTSQLAPQNSSFLPSGARLEEMFMSTSHAKFYTAINTVAIAPCLLGKSNMFRRSQLNLLTSRDAKGTQKTSGTATQEQPSQPTVEETIYPSHPRPGEGIDFFSHNICEDHLIGDLLWRSPLFTSSPPHILYKNHALLPAPLAIQPLTASAMPLSAYVARRVRWLRVRKFTVPLATLVEPGTEAFLGCAVGVVGVRGASRWALGWGWVGVWVFAGGVVDGRGLVGMGVFAERENTGALGKGGRVFKGEDGSGEG